MPIQESSATALIRVTGLAICCLNQEGQTAEFALIRDEDHKLAARIKRPGYQDGANKDIIVYRDIVSYEQLPKENVQIEIKALQAPAISGFEVYQNGDFDRLGAADVNDFRWTVNIDLLHDNAPLNPTGEQHWPLTKFYLSNCLLYTHKLDQKWVFEKIEKNAQGVAGQREVFGNVAETIGAMVEAPEVGFSIRIGDREETHLLKRVEGLPFIVEITNMNRSENAVFSDMPDYYKYLSSPTGTQFELTPIREDDDETATGGAVNQQDFCHPIVSNLRSIDEL
ncbi:MAG TPA: hypothetical protein VF290_28625 [Pyrinomonadaceae bacterium]